MEHRHERHAEIANGMIGGAWWWHTAFTSGRALKISPWITRSE
jgi:hypothetical protein